MKLHNIIRCLGAVAMFAIVTACSDEIYKEVDGYYYTTENLYLSINPNNISFDSQGNTSSWDQPYLNASHSWNASGIAPWASVTPSRGEAGYYSTGEITVSTTENNSTTSRVNIVTFGLNEFPAVNGALTITQSGETPKLSFETSGTVSVEAAGGTFSFPLVTNIPDSDISLKIIPTNANLKAEVTNGVLNVTIGPNSSTSTKTMYVYLSANVDGYSLSASKTFSQGRASISGYESVSFTAAGGTQNATFTSNIPCRIVNEASWLTVTPAKGISGTNTLTITASQNGSSSSRTAVISIYPEDTDASRVATISVSQAGIKASASEKVFENLSARGERVEVVFTSDVDWKASSSATWVEIVPAQGKSGSTTVVINVAPNASAGNRNATIMFTTLTDGTLYRVDINQKAASLSVTPSSLVFEGKGGTKTVEIVSDIAITDIKTPSWININEDVLLGNSTLTVTAERNPSTTERTGEIVISTAGGVLSETISVKQEAIGLADDNDINLTWKSQDYNLSLNTDRPWSAALSTSEWMSLSDYSGQPGDGTTLTVTENTTEDPRTGSILISSGGQTHIINVIQQGQYMRIDGSEATLPVIASSIDLALSSTIGAIINEIRYSQGSEEWLHYSMTDDGTDVYSYTFNADANPNAFTRSAEIVFAPAAYDGTVEHQGVIYTLYQKGREITVSASTIFANGAAGTSEDVEINADGPYTVTRANSDTWFIVNHTGNHFNVTTTPNTTGSTRRGRVFVSLSDLPAGQEGGVTVEVVQSDSSIGFTIDDYNSNIDY